VQPLRRQSLLRPIRKVQMVPLMRLAPDSAWAGLALAVVSLAVA
jgi:hypothetical protein